MNVGGPDGRRPGETPECTVGTVVVPYHAQARGWLWHELDAVRRRYLERWVSEPDSSG